MVKWTQSQLKGITGKELSLILSPVKGDHKQIIITDPLISNGNFNYFFLTHSYQFFIQSLQSKQKKVCNQWNYLHTSNILFIPNCVFTWGMLTIN